MCFVVTTCFKLWGICKSNWLWFLYWRFSVGVGFESRLIVIPFLTVDNISILDVRLNSALLSLSSALCVGVGLV